MNREPFGRIKCQRESRSGVRIQEQEEEAGEARRSGQNQFEPVWGRERVPKN
jgi:hypothetical protein